MAQDVLDVLGRGPGDAGEGAEGGSVAEIAVRAEKPDIQRAGPAGDDGVAGHERRGGKTEATGEVVGAAAGNIAQERFIAAELQAGDDLVQGAVPAAGDDQVRSFARYLNAIDCFYTDRPVDFDMLNEFTDKMTSVFAPMEHCRWVRDHQAAGWLPGDEYETLPVTGDEKAARNALREQLRRHKLTLPDDASEPEIYAHYDTLSPEDQGKDYLPYNSMLKLLRKYDGLRIYKLDRE